MLQDTNALTRKKAAGLMIIAGGQISTFAVSGLIAFLLRFEFSVPQTYIFQVLLAVCIWVFCKSFVFYLYELDGRCYRYISIKDANRLLRANILSSLISALAIIMFVPLGFPRSIYVIDFALCTLLSAGVRVAARLVAESLQNGHGSAPERRTFIYGAGESGVALLREIRNNPRLAYDVRGFLDDRPDKNGILINGVRVFGVGEQLAALVRKHRIEVILIAIPSATGLQMTRILEHCQAAKVDFKTVPGLGEIIEEGGRVGPIREVAVEDLLGRNPVRLEEHQILRSISGKLVMVTGAAGSIGSELCRQIARFRPAGIVGFEIAESPLFEIDREMRKSFPNVPFFAEIGSVQNRARLDEVLSLYRPAVIYHAAAYKHVPLMETHVFEAVENNVLGTHCLAVAALDHGVEDFVMISSDKAVRPTSVMGATKRLAEVLLLGLQNGSTQFVTVRFGNVLGSNGSVIPIFKKQILAGGPVTVTHPDMQRFFMTIPEACQLVLQAAAIGKGGQICVLDMGQPVKIVDLARNLILLSGLRPDEDIQIEFTGMRPGEKLYEELSMLTEDTVPTVHEKVRIFVGNGVPDEEVHTWVGSLRQICSARDLARLVVTMKELVLDYNPSSSLLRRILAPEEANDLTSVTGS